MTIKVRERFKDDRLQRIYFYLINNPPYLAPHIKIRKTGSSLHEWFWKGYDGIAFRFVVRTSWSHAAWAAGQDYKKWKDSQ